MHSASYQLGQFVGALIPAIFVVWALHRALFRRLVSDETLAVAVSGIAAYVVILAIAAAGAANGGGLSLAGVPFIKFGVAVFLACCFRIWRDNGVARRRDA